MIGDAHLGPTLQSPIPALVACERRMERDDALAICICALLKVPPQQPSVTLHSSATKGHCCMAEAPFSHTIEVSRSRKLSQRMPECKLKQAVPELD